MITPTIGRVVWFFSAVSEGEVRSTQAEPAFVCYVHSNRLVNVGGFDCNGVPFKQTSVPLLQDDDPVPASGFFAQWMPYQVATANAAK